MIIIIIIIITIAQHNIMIGMNIQLLEDNLKKKIAEQTEARRREAAIKEL